MSTLADLEAALADLNARFPRPCMAALALSEPWAIPEDWPTPKSFPNSDYPGVYVFLGPDEDVLYVGSTYASLGQRVGNEYIGRNGVIKCEKVAGATSLRTIKVPKERAFEAPAIELFLIGVLQPPRNTNGK